MVDAALEFDIFDSGFSGQVGVELHLTWVTADNDEAGLVELGRQFDNFVNLSVLAEATNIQDDAPAQEQLELGPRVLPG